MADIDVLVVGAGVVGLAIAQRLAMAGLSTVIADCEDMIGTGTSSRNSEVIHAGLHYDGLPLKAALCVAGRHQLYRYCAERAVPHRRCGKLITAFSPAEVPMLERIAAAGERADVDDLQLLSGEEAARLEPAIACEAALLSPSTGIIDSHAFMVALLADAEAGRSDLCPTDQGRSPDPDKGGRLGDPSCRRKRRRGDSADGGECGRTRRAGDRAADRRAPARTGAATLLCAGRLLRLSGRDAIYAADLSGAGSRRAGHAPHARHVGLGALRARCRMDRYARL